MPDIRLENLVKRYGDVEVLHRINLEMEDKEFTVLVGPSGCGKSTTLRMIAGLETVSGGEIYIGNEPISHLNPKDRGLAMVFQDYALYPHMNVADNMSFALRLRKVPRSEIDKKVKEVAEIVDLSDYLHRKPGELSGGQRQRVAMGRALAKDSPIFLFDEPLSNLDAKLRSQMRTELALMSQRVNKNMIYVTHDQVEAMTLADRIVVMHGGHIQQQGTPKDLFENPVNKFVAGFLGMPPMNFLDAKIEQKSGSVFVTGQEFSLRLSEEKAAAAKLHKNNNIIVGIRPSDISYDAKARKEESLNLHVKISEYIGSQSVLICNCGNENVTVELKSEIPIGLGKDLKFKVDPTSIHLFDRETEIAL